MKKNIVPLLAGAIAASPMPPASADEQPIATVTITAATRPAFDTVADAGSRLGLTLAETPASVEVIDRALMEQRGARTLEDALGGAVGMTVGGNPGSPGVASTRGFTGGFITYLYDGARISTATMSTRPQDSWNYERIEVLKGPSSVLHGEGGIGGAVNFVPRQARREASAEALLSVGSYGARRAAFGLGGAAGSASAWRIDVSHNRHDGWIDRTGQKLTHLTAAWQTTFRPGLRLDLSLDRLRDDLGAYYGTPLVQAALAGAPTGAVSDPAGRVIDRRVARINYNLLDAVMDADSLWLRARLSWEPAPGWTLRNELSRYDADRLWRNAEGNVFGPPANVVRTQSHVSHAHRVWSDRFDLGYQGTLAGLRHRFVAGVELTHTAFASDRRFSDGSATTRAALQVDLFDPDQGYYDDSRALTTGPGNRALLRTRVRTAAAFAEDALTLVPGLTVVTGLRRETIRLENEVDDLNLATRSAFARRYRPTSARAGVVWEAWPDMSLYGQAGTAAAPVGSSNLLLMNAASAAYPLTRGRQFEVGIKQRLAGRFDWSAALYRLRQTDVLSRDPDQPNLTVNNGRISSRGVELSASWHASPALSLAGNLSVLDAQYDTLVEAGGVSRVGKLPVNVPERTARLWSDYRIASLDLAVGAGLSYTGERYADNANTVRMNGYALADAYARWRTGPARVTLRVRNLTDRLHAKWTGSCAANQIVLGDPRTVELTADFSL
ncbi:TonB-dependent receptor [Pseudoduganella albidiflava]|uniref:TonB-dependent receptor n=2 Tax=Pseudoduganella albidiflava TaxID=321983 RepID=A0AA87XQJ7_9BURK|nr:TonB-dependent siderophore receptor [Pseudoduganella albidiflava]GGY30607.1 TonB-dependent receptor [Pseudoduganella albidiflava]